MANLSPETKRRILDVAADLFAHRSFEQVRMEDVASGAKIGKVTIYRYFPTKDDLYLKLLEEIGRDYLEKVRDADTSVRGCRARLIAIVRVALDFFYSRPHVLKLLDRAGIDGDRQTDFPWLDVQQQFFRMLQGLLAEGTARGEFEVGDLELGVRALIGAMRFQFLYPSVEVSREEVPERLVGMILRPNTSFMAKRAA